MSLHPSDPTEQNGNPQSAESATGLAHWSEAAVAKWRDARRALSEANVHDLRVAVRRCRSMAEGLAEIDPDPGWRRFRRQGRKLFRSLGQLRDLQVMQIWLAKLAPEDDPVRLALETLLAQRENAEKTRAAKALKRFEPKKWLKTAARLAKRAEKLPVGGLAFQHQALQRWMEAYDLHRRAMRDRSKTAYHRLRIGLKRFRYTVENFLPDLNDAWKKSLKDLQDQLGDIHDLDVLWDLLPQSGGVFDAEAGKIWRKRIDAQRRQRLAAYRRMMVGSGSRWPVWRGELPSGETLEEAAVATLAARTLLNSRDPGRAAAREALSERLYDILSGCLHGSPFDDRHWKHVLRGAACLDDAPQEASAKVVKRIAKSIQALSPPVGWHPEDLGAIAEIARCRRVVDAEKLNKRLARESLPRRKAILTLSGIFRLAAFLERCDVQPGDLLTAETRQKAIALRLRARSEPDRLLLEVGAWKNLLEWASRRPLSIELDNVQAIESISAT